MGGSRAPQPGQAVGRRRPDCHRPERRPFPLGVGQELQRCAAATRRTVVGAGLDKNDRAILEAAYGELPQSLRPLVTVQFGSADAAAAALLGDAGAIVQTEPERVSEQPWQERDRLLVAVMDGRSVWSDPYKPVAASLADVPEAADVLVVPSTSLMFLPVTTGRGSPRWVPIRTGEGRRPDHVGQGTAKRAHPATPAPSVPEFPPVGEVETRAPREERRAARADLDLLRFPPTTGSLPRLPRFAGSGCRSAAARSTSGSTTTRSTGSSRMRCGGRRRPGSTCWSMVSSSAPTWSSSLASGWMGFSPPTTGGSTRTARDASVPRSWPLPPRSRSR